jgi:hypothetical protein
MTETHIPVNQVFYNGFALLVFIGFCDESSEQFFSPTTPQNTKILFASTIHQSLDLLNRASQNRWTVDASAHAYAAIIPHSDWVGSAWTVLLIPILQQTLKTADLISAA